MKHPNVGEVWELDPEADNRLTVVVLALRTREDDRAPVVDVLVLDDLLYPNDVGHVKEWLLKEFLDPEEPQWTRIA